MNEKILCFDMDGTLADFYGVNGWLNYLNENNPAPYQVAAPMYDENLLNGILSALKSFGWRIVIISWLAKDSTKDFDTAVRTAKREWLEQYSFPYDEIHLVKYGTPKKNTVRRHDGIKILVDDNAEVRKAWGINDTINANENIMPYLFDILAKEFDEMEVI